MQKQLRLIEVASRSVPTRRSERRQATRPGGGRAVHARLDDDTRARGLEGVARARDALVRAAPPADARFEKAS